MNRLKQTHLVFAILSALSLTACGGSSSSKDMTNTDNNTSQNGGAGSDSSGNDSTGNDSNDSDSTGSDTSGSDSSSSSSSESGSSSSSGSGSSTSNPTVLTNDQIIAASDVKSRITPSIRDKIKIATDGKLDVTASETLDASTPNVYDIGINGLETGATLDNDGNFSQLGKKVLAVKDGDKTIYLRDPTGWEYQTFGQVFEGTDSKGYASIGKPQENVKKASAYYTGVAMGTVNGESEVAAQMSAIIDVDAKTLDLNIYNSYISEGNIAAKSYAPAVPKDDYNFKEKGIVWDPDTHAFKKDGDNAVEARLYGPNAQEIGGTYQRKDQKLKGAFGGVKTTPKEPSGIGRRNGAVAIYFDNKFKAMDSVVHSKGKHIGADWNKLMIKEENSLPASTDNTTTSLGNELKTIGVSTFDLTAAQKTPQTTAITLKNGKKVAIDYRAIVDEHKGIVEDGKYVVQSVHVFGNRNNTESNVDGYPSGDGKFNAAYMYGQFTPKDYSLTFTGEAQYSGSATYRSHAATDSKVEKGTSSFYVNFTDKIIKNGQLVFTETGRNFDIPDMKIGDEMKPDKGQQFFETTGFGNSGKFVREGGGVEARGHFFGEKADYLGGVFHTADGIGTFFSEKETP